MRSVHPRSRAIGLVLSLCLAAMSPGCGMTGYSIRPPYDTRIKTVYVPIFKSITFRRDVNLQLTELVIKEIERRTPYKVVGRPEDADSTLDGTVNFSDKNVIVENPFNLPRQLTSTMIVVVTWTDNKAERKENPNPAVIAETFNFYPEIGETSQAAFYRTSERLATQIVNMMEEPW
ncbi:LPS assembly lipoprotein LptE [Tundrisphaera lichenicola]|uniref:LPS assembly lipoprotein LptE n=1 Tax=Tundrisphaera lichenicola TaxID=2029860 RepID=UPI003EBEE48E